jgi:hypothetical protein
LQQLQPFRANVSSARLIRRSVQSALMAKIPLRMADIPLGKVEGYGGNQFWVST